jgi:hypothetical protein
MDTRRLQLGWIASKRNDVPGRHAMEQEFDRLAAQPARRARD